MNPEKSEKLLFIFFIFVFSYKHTFYVSELNICTVLKKSITLTNNALKSRFHSTRNCWKALTDNKTYIIWETLNK
jgi:hypothetical protein